MSFSKSFSITCFILFVLLLASLSGRGASAVSEKSGPALGSNHALIIGISNYDSWPKLISPVKDAEAIAKILTEKYNFKKSNTVLLTDNSKEKPTLANIINYLAKFSSELTENDNLLIFFSGHSKEEDDGETYWIPQNGQKDTRMTWLKHSAIAEEFFLSEKFKAKNLCIITDSPFSSKLIKSRPISLTPYDLRYPEKITEKAALNSREVISFGDQHWPGSKDTQGFGLFAFYIRQALLENTLEVIDFENLIFEENILFSVSKIAGTKMHRGRFRSGGDEGGQFVINKLAPVPLIDIVEAAVDPRKGYPGDNFLVKATTSGPASDVFIDLAGKRHRMSGSGSEWRFNAEIDRLGKTAFSIAAINERDVAGKPRKGEIITIRKQAPVSNVSAARVQPGGGIQGGRFRFSVTTDTPAEKVDLIIQGRHFKMDGSGTQWVLSRKIEDIGAIDFSAVATNEDGVQGRAGQGKVEIKAAAVNVVEVKANPQSGYAGEEFTITARTNRPAQTVSIQLDGNTYPMEGSGNLWRFKKAIPEIGRKPFTVIAQNVEGASGKSQSGELLTKRSPLPIPDVAAVDVSVVSPGRGYPGDRFEFKVKTSAPSEAVLVNIDGELHPMTGSGSDWTYIARVDKLGESKYQVIARNKDGAQGQSREGVIATINKPLEPVRVLSAEVTPPKGFSGTDFTFRATTDRPAKDVMLTLGRNRYSMIGSDTGWRLTRKIDQTGSIDFSITARNAEDVEGPAKMAVLAVEKELVGFAYNNDGTVTDRKTGEVKNRFVDNGDGTVTDLLTSLMWLKQPKTIPVDYDSAVEYCRTLEFRGYTGWRLPTITEFQKLIDKKQRNPSLPPKNPFANVLTHVGYWSKTKHKFGPQYVYQMNLWYGKVGHIKKSENSVVWPVRYAELKKEG